MDYIIESIVSGIIYDIVSKGAKVNFANVFGSFNTKFDLKNVQNLLNEINSNIKSIQSEIDVMKIIESDSEYMDVIEQVTYNTEFAKRLDYVMHKMNLALSNENKLNIDSLSKWIGFSSSNEIKRYYLETEEPKFDFEKTVADKIGVNVEWIQTGNGTPFKSILPRDNRAWHILDQSNLPSIKDFLFLSNTRRELIIIERFDKYKYLYIPHRFIFHPHVGGSGASELFSLYSVLKELRKKGNRFDCGVYEISDDDFNRVLIGEQYPLECINKGVYVPSIIDDFIDIYNGEKQKEIYISHYGKDFVIVQDIVRSMVQRKLSNK